MIVKMILSQICENTGRIGKAVDSFHVNGVGGNLHDNIITVGRKHKRKKRMKLIRVGGRVFGGQRLVAYHVLNGSDKADLVPEMLQNGFKNGTGGGFAVCSGHTDDFKLFCGISEKGGAHKRIGLSCIVHNKLVFKTHIVFADNNRGSVLCGGLCKFVSVGSHAVYTDKGVPLINLSGILFYI